jgi:hypothetical protein
MNGCPEWVLDDEMLTMRPPAGLDHVGQHGLDGVEHTVQVHVDDPGPFLEGQVQKLFEAFHPGRVDQHKDRAERFPNR